MYTATPIYGMSGSLVVYSVEGVVIQGTNHDVDNIYCIKLVETWASDPNMIFFKGNWL